MKISQLSIEKIENYDPFNYRAKANYIIIIIPVLLTVQGLLWYADMPSAGASVFNHTDW